MKKRMIIMTNEEKWMNGWISDRKGINQSPFFKESHHGRYVRGEPMEKVDFKIPKTAYKDLMTYFKGNGLSKSEGFNQLVSEKLSMINTHKRTIFNNIELVLMIPKTGNLKELNDKSFILTLYNTKTDFENEFIYDDGFNKTFNFHYELMDFSFLPIDIFNNLKKNIEFHLSIHNPYKTGEFKDYHQRLEENQDLKLSDYYFVRFPLNNYLDIKREGQYQHSGKRGYHEGLYVFDDFNHHRLYFRLEWKYAPYPTSDFGSINLRGYFMHQTDFMYTVKNADMKNVRDCHESLLNNTHDREFMESALKDAEEMKDWIENQIAFYEKNLGR